MSNGAAMICRMSLIVCSMLLFVRWCCADSNTMELLQADKTPIRKILNPTAPYCGVQAVCLAARAINKDVDFSQMVQSQYIGSKQGSTLAELQSLCEVLNLKTQSFSRLTVNSLYGATCPVILHTSPQTDLKNYDHWTLFTGIKDGKAMTWQVVNGESANKAISLDELAAQWDGNAVAVFNDSGTGIYFAFFVWIERIFLIGLIVLCMIVLVNINSFFQRHGNRFNTCAGLCVILVISGLTYFVHSNVLYPESFLVNDNAIKNIQEDHTICFFPKMSLEKVKKTYQNDNTIIIDARIEHQYQQGHIENSVNIP